MQGLRQQIENKKAELAQKDVEIQQYQKTIMRLTRELEKIQDKVAIIDEQ